MKNKELSLRAIVYWFEILALFFFSLWLIVIRPLGPNLTRMPSDLGDARFNNYILEHDYRWITGQDSSLWTAPFFYPYSQTLTFSDNHFGSMFLYDTFRGLGLDRETAFQAWYLLSYFLNFGAAVFVLRKLKLNPLAIALGAFFFTFGLPVLGQENHVQLFYRFCIPLACYSFWQFSLKPQFKLLALTLFWLVWQFYLSIYLGFFLSLLLMVAAVGLAIVQSKNFVGILTYWPDSIKQAWQNAKSRVNIFYLITMALLLFALVLLFQPYVAASKTYGFTRTWGEISVLLPGIQSYFIADHSILWQPFAFLSSNSIQMRWEHQLFIGMAASILLLLGLVWRFKSPHRKMAFLFIATAAFLVLVTLNFDGFSFYKLLWKLPGFNSIRAMTRIILVLIWPVALFISVVFNALLQVKVGKVSLSAVAVILFGLMLAESGFYTHATFSKAEAKARLQNLRERIPTTLPADPVLFVWNPDISSWYLNELDAMLLSQELGWPVMNGYSGNLPDGYGETTSCDDAVTRIIKYMHFEKIEDSVFYNDLLSRVVSVGPVDCQWPSETPSLSFVESSGPFSQELFSGISIKILQMAKKENYLSVQLLVENHSSQTLPVDSSSGNPFRLAWRLIDAVQDSPVSEFNNRKDLVSDIPPGGHEAVTINLVPPAAKGEYWVEISAVQEHVAWFQDRGMIPARSTQIINVDESGAWTFTG